MSDGSLLAFATILAAAIAVGVPATINALGTKRLAAQATDHAATAANAAVEAKQVATSTADAIGTKNGNGDLMTMVARSLGELAEIRGEQNEVKAKLDARTHVLRDGATEPVELGPYMQTWFHDIGTHLQAIRGILHILWAKLADDYDLPPLPPLPDPPSVALPEEG